MSSNSIASWRHMNGDHPSARALALSAPRKAAFLDELRRVGNYATARDNLGLNNNIIGGWRNRDAVFRKAVDALKGGQ